jgi:hypothetical protein
MDEQPWLLVHPTAATILERGLACPHSQALLCWWMHCQADDPEQLEQLGHAVRLHHLSTDFLIDVVPRVAWLCEGQVRSAAYGREERGGRLGSGHQSRRVTRLLAALCPQTQGSVVFVPIARNDPDPRPFPPPPLPLPLGQDEAWRQVVANRMTGRQAKSNKCPASWLPSAPEREVGCWLRSPPGARGGGGRGVSMGGRDCCMPTFKKCCMRAATSSQTWSGNGGARCAETHMAATLTAPSAGGASLWQVQHAVVTGTHPAALCRPPPPAPWSGSCRWRS